MKSVLVLNNQVFGGKGERRHRDFTRKMVIQ